ncbi:2OG-Fe(II) oxygenase [Massilia glaciei]|uniref:Fe2OG dioxygenase domain-containing protein n=1 Tax=Massilia glaciei TaxID=1524097 RepID=A0A2U2HIG3_9BURK|nr:2OG-Fe(II) oxygenase [Massilia glaciei]PWF46126.1 hypothetical protein C7C56_016555 [Massilia glaciei]
MMRDGQFSRTVACEAIEAGLAAAGRPLAIAEAARTGAMARPQIDTSKNTISTPDREVSILLAIDAPRIVVLGNVLSDEECDILVAYSESKMAPSRVVGGTEGDNVLHDARTSSGSFIARGEIEVAARLEARLAAIAQWPVERGEGLQILRYTKGAEYKPHFDWFDRAQPGQARLFDRGGQRVGTFVLYLNDVESGGGTNFPKLGLEVSPKKGGAVFFSNVTADGVPDPFTLHGGMPVLSGVKFVANKWLREGLFV